MGVNEFSNQEISIFPNSTNDFITINFKNQDNPQISIYDITGKKMSKYQQFNSANQLQIDVTTFDSGIYFLKIQEENNVIIRRFIRK